MRLGKQGRKIVGIKINSHWNDGTNGYWRLLEGKVGDDEIEIQFCTAGHKGGHWSAEIWSVDKHLYSYA